jgi:hypothetical protein
MFIKALVMWRHYNVILDIITLHVGNFHYNWHDIIET